MLPARAPLDASRPLLATTYRVTPLLQQPPHRALIDGIVLRQQDVQATTVTASATLGRPQQGARREWPCPAPAAWQRAGPTGDRFGQERADPQLAAARRFAGRSADDSIMMVAPSSAGVLLIRSTSSNPSISGMCASMSTSGNGLPAAAACIMQPSAARAAVDCGWAHLPMRQDLIEDAPVGGVVVDHQDARDPGDSTAGPAGGARDRVDNAQRTVK